MDSYVNRKGIAELQGVSLPTIDAWVREGMPVAEKGGRGVGYKFNPAAVTEWRIDRETKKSRAAKGKQSESELKRRKLAAEADMQELKTALFREELCKQDDLVADIQNDLAKVRARLLAIPNRAAPAVVGGDEREARKTLTDLIHEALDELSTVSLEEFFEPYDPRSLIHEKKCGFFSLFSGHFTVELGYDVEPWSVQANLDKDFFTARPP